MKKNENGDNVLMQCIKPMLKCDDCCFNEKVINAKRLNCLKFLLESWFDQLLITQNLAKLDQLLMAENKRHYNFLMLCAKYCNYQGLGFAIVSFFGRNMNFDNLLKKDKCAKIIKNEKYDKNHTSLKNRAIFARVAKHWIEILNDESRMSMSTDELIHLNRNQFFYYLEKSQYILGYQIANKGFSHPMKGLSHPSEGVPPPPILLSSNAVGYKVTKYETFSEDSEDGMVSEELVFNTIMVPFILGCCMTDDGEYVHISGFKHWCPIQLQNDKYKNARIAKINDAQISNNYTFKQLRKYIAIELPQNHLLQVTFTYHQQSIIKSWKFRDDNKENGDYYDIINFILQYRGNDVTIDGCLYNMLHEKLHQSHQIEKPTLLDIL